MQPLTRYVLNRFWLKSVVLLLVAALPWPAGRLRELAALFAIMGSLDAFLALWRRERLTAPHLTYWDEAAASIAIAIAVTILHR